MSYNTYKPDEVEINWAILAKLTKYDDMDDNKLLLAEELKILFANMSELKIEELLDQVFSINKDLYNFLIKILNDESIDDNYKNYVLLLKNIKELSLFTRKKNILSSYKIWNIAKNSFPICWHLIKIDFNIFKKLVDYISHDLTDVVHFSPNELRNIIMHMKLDENIQILKCFFDLNEEFYWLFQKTLFYEEWNFDEHDYKNVEEEIDELDYSEFENMLESTIRLIYYVYFYKFDYKFEYEIKIHARNRKLIEDIEDKSLLSQKDLIIHVSNMSLDEFELLTQKLYLKNKLLFEHFQVILSEGFIKRKHSLNSDFFEEFKDLLFR
jgi:hypothetical protein